MHQGGIGVTRWLTACPLCRRDVHFLLPLHRNYDPEHPESPPLTQPKAASAKEPSGVATVVPPTETIPPITEPSAQEASNPTKVDVIHLHSTTQVSVPPKTFIQYLRKRLVSVDHLITFVFSLPSQDL